MAQKHPFRMKFSLPDGTRGLFWLLPFDGDGDGRHRFNDHGHAANFVRYLFSQSKAHPRSLSTARNLYRVYGSDGTPVTEAYNEDPAGNLARFMASGAFPKRDAHRELCDDGCYPLFAFRQGKGPLISNMLRRSEDGYGLEIYHPLHAHLPVYLAEHGNDWSKDAELLAGLAGEREPILAFDDIVDEQRLRDVEVLIQCVVRRLMGDEDKVVMTVAHRDQEHHNPIYHIHRLLRC